MALALNDRVQETGTANTTVSFTLSGAITGYQSFAVVGDTNTTYYTATDTSGSWEVGVGTYSTTGPTLTRTTILSSSNSGSAVTFSGTVNVWVDYPAEKAVSTDTLASPPAIGATSPAAGTFTTLTAQTEVLKGTGQNLYVYSEQFDNGQWDKYNVTVTADSTTAPNGTTTADSLIGNGTSGNHRIDQTTRNSAPAGTPKVISVYAKANTNNFIQLYFNGDAIPYANFDLSAGTVGTVGSTTTASIVSSGNGWYRCIAITTSTTATNPGICLISSSTDSRVPTNSLSTSVYLWGCQVEIGSSVGSYVQTTSSAIYGTPTLSFSGVAGLGLQSDGSLYVSPAGTGALQAQKTDSTATGGNARGANAVDFQTLRSVASMIASGLGSVIGGGQNNTSSSYTSFVGAGANNYAQAGNSFVGSGNANVIIGGSSYASIVAGNSNTINSPYSFIGNGLSNTASGYYNFIGGGFTNSGTASAAVTTQSGTMNATTAVTLSGSNANIKVGQYISGTSIAGDTYVAAISGTSLTLSKNASGSSTSTLSFYTPHGVVVGGGNNQATGSYSFIGGGGDAGTAANRNVASGDWSVVVGGRHNTASGIGSAVIGGGTDGTATNYGNTASGKGSLVIGGYSNQATSDNATVCGGYGNQAQQGYSFIGGGFSNTVNSFGGSIQGGYYGITRGIYTYMAFPACFNPLNSSQGASQAGLLILAKQTTDATATVLTCDTGVAGTVNQVILPNNSAYYFRGEVVAGVTGGGNTKGWYVEGVIKRGAGVGTTAIVGTATVTSNYADAGASTWALTATADTTNGGLAITFTGQASTTIRCVAQIRTTEMTY